MTREEGLALLSRRVARFEEQLRARGGQEIFNVATAARAVEGATPADVLAAIHEVVCSWAAVPAIVRERLRGIVAEELQADVQYCRKCGEFFVADGSAWRAAPELNLPPCCDRCCWRSPKA